MFITPTGIAFKTRLFLLSAIFFPLQAVVNMDLQLHSATAKIAISGFSVNVLPRQTTHTLVIVLHLPLHTLGK